uniref:Uncharacterized protein n=1 Tax=Caudovirales sp. ctVfb8 TaxID=2825766 RepID=A0A8S5V3Q3_9CAUD|nr:MAG TPA: hypothetical protein [Caudovirales sp. ctVfb8]
MLRQATLCMPLRTLRLPMVQLDRLGLRLLSCLQVL